MEFHKGNNIPIVADKLQKVKLYKANRINSNTKFFFFLSFPL